MPPEGAITIRAVRRGCATVVAELGGCEPWRPRILGPAGAVARVALVATRASLLGGDRVALDVSLGAGCALEIVELAATIALHARGGPPALLEATVRLGPGARLVWLGEPLIAAAGCGVVRSTRVELARGAVVLLRDALVLGRSGEEPGRARTHTRITLEGRPVLEEALDTEPAWLLASRVVAGPARMIDGLTLAGRRDPDPPSDAFQAHEPATLWRRAGAAGGDGSGGAGGAVARRWRGLALDGGGGSAGAPEPAQACSG